MNDWEKKWAEDIDAKRAEAERILEEKFPTQDRVLHLQALHTEKMNKQRLAEIQADAPPELPTLSERLEASEQNIGFRVMSGFGKLDDIIKGFRSGNTYLVAGLEKSGKSSFLMNMLSNMVKEKQKVGYINTELTDREFMDRMTAIGSGVTTETVEGDINLTKAWVEKNGQYFSYAGVENEADLKQDSILSFSKTIDRMREFVVDGAKVIMVDNLTTFNTITDGKSKGWEILAKCISAIVAFAKEKKVVVFVVIHTKPNVVFGETPAGVRHIVNEDPKKIFEESITVTRKPTLSDVYGGGTALSQMSGALLVWRPYQKFSVQHLNKYAMILLDTFRHAPSGGGVLMEFDGAKSQFIESDDKDIDLSFKQIKEILNQ